MLKHLKKSQAKNFKIKKYFIQGIFKGYARGKKAKH